MKKNMTVSKSLLPRATYLFVDVACGRPITLHRDRKENIN